MSLDPILQMSNLFALLIVFAGGFVRGYTGFGSGLVMTPLFAILWGPVDAVATTAGLSLLATVQLTASSVPLANWRDVAPMLAAAILLVPFGAVLLVSLDPELVKKIIVVLVMGMALITMRGWTYRGPAEHDIGSPVRHHQRHLVGGRAGGGALFSGHPGRGAHPAGQYHHRHGLHRHRRAGRPDYRRRRHVDGVYHDRRSGDAVDRRRLAGRAPVHGTPGCACSG